MNKRERILLIVVVGVLGLLMAYVLLNKLWLGPVSRAEQDRRNVADKVREQQDEIAMESTYLRQLRGYAARTFASSHLVAKDKARDRLTVLAQQAGLKTESLELSPLEALSGKTYKQISWSVKARGQLSDIVNFLYLLYSEPYLQRVETVSVTPVPRSSEVALAAKYSTIVLVAKDGEKLPTTQPAEEQAVASLTGPERAAYEVIVQRDLFRPYIPRRPEPPPQASPDQPPRPQPSRPSPSADFQVVGLPAYGEQAEVYLTNTLSQTTSQYQVGQEVQGVMIAMVDYRPMPRQDNPELLSPSRLILKKDNDFFAVELGQRFSEKRAMEAGELPPSLQPPPSEDESAPASQPAEVEKPQSAETGQSGQPEGES